MSNSKTFKDLKIPLGTTLDQKLNEVAPGYQNYVVYRKSVDARSAKPFWVYSVEVFWGTDKPKQDYSLEKVIYSGKPINIIGTGPAGLFAAVRLLDLGIPVRIFEKGSEAKERLFAINKFWRYGELSPRNNVCFGEGGAGLYSDGKLITRIKSPHIPYVMNRLVDFGAPDEIRYLANPHVGSDKLRRVIPKLRESLKLQGAEFHFDCAITDFICDGNSVKGVITEHGQEFEAPYSILATGHSADDMYHLLNKKNIALEGKSFAVGLRIEHPQDFINECQYGKFKDHSDLDSATYKLAFTDKNSKLGIYSFCMCPGGYVLSSGTSDDGIVCNGMSNYKRNSPYANSAMVVTVDYQKNFGHDVFAGMNFQRSIEQKAKSSITDLNGSKELPAQRLSDFINNTHSSDLPSLSCPSNALPVNLHGILPEYVGEALKVGLGNFDRKLKGFVHKDSVLYGVETRTSSPIRIPRHNETLNSISHQGLLPVGEGAGYAGGITSAACDGVNAADAIVQQLNLT